MRGAALTINAGSSSIKYALFGASAGNSGPVLQRLAAGQVEGLAATPAGRAHDQAFAEVIQRVGDAAAACGGLAVVGHRIVHGGIAFSGPAIVDDTCFAALMALAPLAPLHQPYNLAGVAAARLAFPGVPQVACFDTAFHRAMPALHQRFAIPQAWHDAGVRRYGFHGLSYQSIVEQLGATEPALLAGRVVVAHWGNGASMCGLRAGVPVATTMSFSPLDGLTMGTRCGRIDAAVVLHLIEHHGLAPSRVAALLQHESGLLGLSGLASDMRTLLASDSAAAQLAVEHFVEAALREVAGLAAALRGLDAVVFTGGIGENAAVVRERFAHGASWLGVELDAAANGRGERIINQPTSTVRLRVLHTDEEAVIARHALAVAGDDVSTTSTTFPGL